MHFIPENTKSPLKKYSIYIVAFVIVALSSYILNDALASLNIDEQLSAKITEEHTKKQPFLIEWFSKKETKKVSQKLDALLKRINKNHDFHGSLLVAKKGKILYSNQVGYKDFRKKEFLNEKSAFQLASVSKQFTAAAIMILHERNQIKLTDTVNRYFPDFPYEDVTIKNLLNHTGGLPKYFWVAEHKWKQKKAPTNTEMMDLLEKSKVQRFYKPGRNFDYSNTGYLVLASIVEKVSGLSFSAFVKKNIFEPLDMNDSFVYSYEKDAIKPNQLDGFRIYRKWRHLKINKTINDAIVGDKNVYSTTEDLFKWTLGLNNEKLFSKGSLAQMYTKGETVHGKKIPYGFGFRIKTDEQNKIYHHGKWNGFRTGLTQYIEDDMVVIVLEHTSYEGIAALNNTVKNIVVKNFNI